MINAVTNEEFTVLLTQYSVSEPNCHPWRWRATVLGFPDLSEEGHSREQVIQQIQDRVSDILRHSEIVTLKMQLSPPSTPAGENDALLAQGWDDHGLFKNDSEALKLFDEIEVERDQHPVS